MLKTFYIIILSTTLFSQNSHSLLFDGQDDYLSIPGSDLYNNLGDFSFSVWIKVPQSLSAVGDWDNAKAIINKDHYPEYSNATYNLWFLNGSYVDGIPDGMEALALLFDVDGNTVAGNDIILYTETSNFLDNQWHHITCTRKQSTGELKLFLDGVLVDNTTAPSDIISSPNGFIIGSHVFTDRRFFEGNLDKFSFWNISLEQAQIQSNMNSELAGNEEGLVGHWNFNEGNGNVLTDLSGNENDGTIYGAEWSTDVFNGFLSMEDFTNVGSFSGKDYYISNAGGNYVLGKVACEYLGGNLVTITSEEENNFVINALMEFGGGSNHLWLGLDDQDGDGEYNWVTGEPLDYTNYGAAPSPGEAIEMSTPNGEWNDTPINDNQDYRRYMLEMVNNDGPEYPNHSLSFDGNDYVSINSNNDILTSNNGVSINLYFKKQDFSGHQFLYDWGVYSGANVTDAFRMKIDNGGILETWVEGNDNYSSPGFSYNLNDHETNLLNTWVQVTVVYGMNTTKLYLNGSLVNEATNNMSENAEYRIFDQSGAWYWIGDQGDNQYGFNGLIDEFSIWSKEFSDSDVQSIQNASFHYGEEHLVGYWTFNEGEGNLVHDHSGNGYDGTVNGATWSDDGAPVMPASIASVEVGTVQGYPNSEISVPVHIDLMQESVSSIEISFSEFQDHMEFIDLELEGALVGDAEWDVVLNSQEDLLLTLSYGANEISGEGVLFHLTFNIPEEIDTDFVPVMVEHVHLDELEGDIEILNGGVEINAIVWGDVSQNGDVSGYDASLVLKYLVGTEELDENQLFVADVTQDATISALDASAIAQYVVQLIDVLPLDDPASVSGGGEFYVNDTELIPGDILEIPIELASGENLLSFEFSAEYDESVFTLEEVVWSDLIDHFSIEENLVPGSINIAGMGTTPDGEEGIFGTIHLYVNPEFSDQNTSVNMNYRINESVPVENINVVITNSTLGLENSLTPKVFALHQNYPNPFNPITQIKYDIAEDSFVRITIYDVMGRNIRTLMNVIQSAGYHSIRWDAKNDMGKGISAGIYIYTIQAGESMSFKKMVLLK